MLFAPAAFGGPPSVPKVSHEQPGPIPDDQLVAYEKAIAPYVSTARASFSNAKRAFLAGLPKHEELIVFRWWQGKSGKSGLDEIGVTDITNGTIKGRGAHSMRLEAAFMRQEGYGEAPEDAEHGDGVAHFVVEFPETELLDWAIIRLEGLDGKIEDWRVRAIEGDFLGTIGVKSPSWAR